MTTNVELSARAERDLRRIKRGPDRKRLVVALQALAGEAANLDVKALHGKAPWRRLRVGDYRVLYRPVERGLWVERVIDRRDLDRAVATL
ncbi:MAG TPA: type II toxin-antitoxin system RelE/ParE family toxin [Acidimicrobiales bacterium]|nr:type II toxin-antitoxin system RelE/ParE family toxin [Acidimicrobiales bacterium]